MRGLDVQLYALFAASCDAMLALAAAALILGHGFHAMTFGVIAAVLYIPVWILEVSYEDEDQCND